jgi:putative peptidoglycan lipid II flippase
MGKAALIVSGGVLLSRLLGQLREIIFAGMLGADAVTDQYVAAFRIPDFLNYLLAGGFLSITFIPIFSRYLADDDESGGWEALSAIVRPIAAGITLLVAIGWVVAPWVIRLIYPDFTPAQVATTTHLTRVVLPAQVFFVVGALFTAVQYARNVFTIPTLAPVIYNVAIIAGGVGYAAASGTADPEGFAWGALVGAFLGNFVIQWWGARRVGMRIRWLSGWRHPALVQYLAIALPLMIGQSIVVLDETFMSTFGDLVGDGAQSQLQYARRTMFVPIGIIAQAAGVAAYPLLARLFAERRHRDMADTVDVAMRWVLVLSLAATGLLAAMAVPVTRALFQRGSFDAADTQGSATALFFYSFAIPIWGALQVLSRAFYARTQMWTPVVVGSAATVAAVPIYVALQRSLGLRGVAAASVIVLGGYSAALAAAWYREPQHRGRAIDVAYTAGRAVPLVFAGGAVAFAISEGVANVAGTGFVASSAAVLLGTAGFGVAALGAGSALFTVFVRAPAPDRSSG